MDKVFVPKNMEPKPGLNVGILLNRPPTKGEVGIEIEVEGKKLVYHEDTPSPWRYEEDHSLRGEEHAEYVLLKPIKFADVPKTIEKLWAAFKSRKTVFDDSNRTSVHVHLNCQEFHLNRLTALMGLWFALEEPLTAWCGEYREGNMFCLRGVDAPATVTYIKNFIKSDGNAKLFDSLHYAGMNPHALQKYGSLEIRTLRGCSDPQIIIDWMKIIERLYRLSDDFPDPRNVCTLLSSVGPLQFFEQTLGDMAQVVRKTLPWGDDDIADSVYRGIRLAQDICYCRDWSLYKPFPLKPDPFNRKMKHIAAKVIGAGNTGTVLNNDSMFGSSVPPSPPNSPFIQEFAMAPDEPEPEYDDMPEEEWGDDSLPE